MSRLHDFKCNIEGMELPRLFTFPFHYTPHPLCVEAAREVQEYVAGHSEWADELALGKMLGVLVVQAPDSPQPQFLAAFSGNVAGSNDLPYFVPAVYDLLNPEGEFKQGEAAITSINHRIAAMMQSPSLVKAREQLATATQRGRMCIEDFKREMADAKARRDAMRDAGELSAEDSERLLNESRYMKAELKRLRQRVEADVAASRKGVAELEDEIATLKSQRKTMSEALQERIFRLFVVENALGERCDLTDIFAAAEGKLPPSGSGECCAPKLLHYAYTHGFKPLCMAEFWWGESPQGEVRHHGHYYPACRSKCKPILDYMLQGLEVEENVLARPVSSDDLEVVYDDQWLTVVNKPSGMLSVPGKLLDDSAQTRFQRLYPLASGPIVVHRLDQETSGLLVFAKDKDTHKALQEQFACRAISKTYIAVLDGVVAEDAGVIELPLRPDVDDRPRQMVDPVHGKNAVTSYKVLERKDGRTLIEFRPHTGRTHQLRVHASHPQGLNAPIVGDVLYGTSSSRLMLHAGALAFLHPHTGELVAVTCPCQFSL
ncbi:MAG: pseudouridine synthase [Muribaculaceae bacterium]|nr:pseudouridine synthase [Muribaculaceae bacterium]